MKSNAQVKQEVISELNDDIAINARQICVEVRDGVVTLSGQVASYAEKWDAERAVQRVSRAGPASDSERNADMASCADGVLKWMTALPMNSVKVVVEKDSITLSGEVDRSHPSPSLGTDQVPPVTIGLDESPCGVNPVGRVVNNITVNC
ncbi:BON domain-containing protein [Rhodoferax sp.]|uniref:BON domain-containing protein n=1 Tax=Rhodoferax sp. TaxID=50421 RepID=UPI002767BF66|nr:BON domain-containing protein [Rhodoferax sp.]